MLIVNTAIFAEIHIEVERFVFSLEKISTSTMFNIFKFLTILKSSGITCS